MTGVLAASLFVLAVDRATQAPADAEAAAPEQAAADGAAALVRAPAGESAAPPSPRRQPVAELLTRFSSAAPAEAEPIADAFAPSPGWVGAASYGDAAGDASLQAARRFAQTHALTAVMSIGDGGFAIVNQNIIRKGDVLDGFTLIEVRSDGAVFRSGRHEVRLDVPVTSR